MVKQWTLEVANERFSVIARPAQGAGTTGVGAVVYEVHRVSPTPERIGEIHEVADGTCQPAAFRDEPARKTLEALIPTIHKKFHSVTRRLPNPKR